MGFGGRPGTTSRSLVDLPGLAKAGFGLVVVASGLSQQAEVVLAGDRAGQLAQALVDRQGLAGAGVGLDLQ